MAAMKPRTGDGPLEATKEGRGIVMRVPLEGGGRLVVELTPDEAAALGDELKAVTSSSTPKVSAQADTLRYISRVCSAMCAQENSAMHRWRPASPYLRAVSGSATSELTASARRISKKRGSVAS